MQVCFVGKELSFIHHKFHIQANKINHLLFHCHLRRSFSTFSTKCNLNLNLNTQMTLSHPSSSIKSRRHRGVQPCAYLECRNAEYVIHNFATLFLPPSWIAATAIYCSHKTSGTPNVLPRNHMLDPLVIIKL